jgi:hypothetical protein
LYDGEAGTNQENFLGEFGEAQLTGADGSLLSGFALQELVGVWAGVQAVVTGEPQAGFIGLAVGASEGPARLELFCDDVLRRVGIQKRRCIAVVNQNPQLSVKSERFLGEKGEVQLRDGVVASATDADGWRLLAKVGELGVKTTNRKGARKEEWNGLQTVYAGIPIGDQGAPREISLLADVQAYARLLSVLASMPLS